MLTNIYIYFNCIYNYLNSMEQRKFTTKCTFRMTIIRLVPGTVERKSEEINNLTINNCQEE